MRKSAFDRLAEATAMDRVFVTSDMQVVREAQRWHKAGRPFSGVIYVDPKMESEQVVEEIARLSETKTPEEMKNTVLMVGDEK